MPYLVALLCGGLFGFGLALSDMINPAKVLNFLDVAGAWDPSLALVMGGALLVTVPGFALVLRRPVPLFATAFSLPTRHELDARLIGGASLFGLGWGLSGLCPGPAIAGLVSGAAPLFGFVLAMLAGYRLMDWWEARAASTVNEPARR